ncbi:MAG TPA: hypothetical protein VH877_33710 [Polyangia bacterium]|jgi:hypothetical protein|nr:hypothetical protein [Polyangia bacterium]
MKIRHILLVSLALALALSFGASARKRGRSRSPKLLEKAEGPVTLKLESVTQQGQQVVALLSGVTRAPESRLFNFHTDEDRHFIALDARCEAVGALLRCTLKLPRPYLKGHIVGMTAHLRGRDVEADPREVEAMFAAARTHALPDAGGGDAEEDEDEGDGGASSWELQDAGWHQEDEAADDTEEWKYLRGGH